MKAAKEVRNWINKPASDEWGGSGDTELDVRDD